jgi:hypothetical protein
VRCETASRDRASCPSGSLYDLVKRGLRKPEFLIVDGGTGLEQTDPGSSGEGVLSHSKSTPLKSDQVSRYSCDLSSGRAVATCPSCRARSLYGQNLFDLGHVDVRHRKCGSVRPVGDHALCPRFGA